MEQRSRLRNDLKKGLPGLGVALTLASPPVIKTLLSNKQLNWIFVDGEHGQITDKDYFNVINHVAAANASPILRVPLLADWMIKRALDAGAHGIVLPMCHNAEDARRAVSYSKYPPLGIRGYGPTYCGHSFDIAEADYAAEANDHILVMVQIESPEGVENVDEIANVPGVDVLFIGPYDLSKQMKVQFGSDVHEAAIQKTLQASKKAGKCTGIFCNNAETANLRLSQGFEIVTICTDINMLAAGISQQVSLVRDSGLGPHKAAY